MYHYTNEGTTASLETAVFLTWSLISILHGLIIEKTEEIREDEYSFGHEIRKYIDLHYKEDISHQSIADGLHVNKYHMAHIFRAYTGYSPSQYIIRRRIGRAQILLFNSDISIADIAEQIGFNNINHFHNTFRSVVGMTPGRYREQCKRMDTQSAED
jgi:AraC-like DNA-binding protein